MRCKVLGLMTALLIGLAAASSGAGDAVKADVIVYLNRVQPTHQLVRTSRVELRYGDRPGAIGFAPAGNEREAVGPSAFDVDRQGAYVVADPVHQTLVRVEPHTGIPVTSTMGALPLPLSDLAVDADGFVYVMDQRSRTLTTIGPSTTSQAPLPHSGPGVRFVRYGSDVVISGGSAQSLLRRGLLSAQTNAVRVDKCNAEAGRLTLQPTGRRIQVEIGAPLASIRLIGINAAGDIFLVVERFRQRRRLAVDRQAVVLDSTGGLKAQMEVHDKLAVHPVRDFVLGPRGKLHRMAPSTRGVTFEQWELRP